MALTRMTPCLNALRSGCPQLDTSSFYTISLSTISLPFHTSIIYYLVIPFANMLAVFDLRAMSPGVRIAFHKGEGFQHYSAGVTDQ